VWHPFPQESSRSVKKAECFVLLGVSALSSFIALTLLVCNWTDIWASIKSTYPKGSVESLEKKISYTKAESSSNTVEEVTAVTKPAVMVVGWLMPLQSADSNASSTSQC